jgi:MSHA biogenesis protein MshL
MKKTSDAMRRILAVLLLGLLSACATTTPTGTTYDGAKKEMANAARLPQSTSQSEDVGRALMPPLKVEMPKVDGRLIEPRFDLAVNNAPAGQVFMAIVSGTRYSMVVHPGVKEPISVNLRDVTVFEALDTIREVYGYEYKMLGNRILIEPLSLQTRVYQVNYLMSLRKGKTEVRVSSGSISDSVPNAGGAAQPAGTTTGTGVSTQSLESVRVVTTSTNDFWVEINAALNAIVGKEGGRNVVVSPQSGVIVVRALPSELRGVADFLKTMQVVIERQVMLEAKIIEVQLSDTHQSGVNWAAFGQGANSRVAGGVLGPGSVLQPSGPVSAFTSRNPDGSVAFSSLLTSNPASPASILAGPGTPGTLFGLAFQTSNFAALISFLET